MDRTNGRTSRGQYSMRFKLVNKRTKEVVDRLDVVKSEEQIAREVFQNNKQLDKESFDRLYEVKKDDRD
jgi:hypothetical protein